MGSHFLASFTKKCTFTKLYSFLTETVSRIHLLKKKEGIFACTKGVFACITLNPLSGTLISSSKIYEFPPQCNSNSSGSVLTEREMKDVDQRQTTMAGTLIKSAISM